MQHIYTKMYSQVHKYLYIDKAVYQSILEFNK